MTNKEIEEKKDINPFIQESEPETQPEMVESPQEDICEQAENDIKAEYETLKNQYVRLAADFDNYRKRQVQEREALLKYGAEDTLKKLLPAIDNFERAQKSLIDVDDPQKIKESFDIVQKQFLEVVEKIGLQKIETVGQEFNPEFHEAVMQTPTNEHPDHTVIMELQSGYKLGDRVIRPALVNVAVNE